MYGRFIISTEIVERSYKWNFKPLRYVLTMKFSRNRRLSLQKKKREKNDEYDPEFCDEENYKKQLYTDRPWTNYIPIILRSTVNSLIDWLLKTNSRTKRETTSFQVLIEKACLTISLR